MSRMLFEPVSLDHSARLIGRTPWEASRDSGILAEAVVHAARLYRQKSCVVGIDVYNVESEAYGCQVQEPAGDGVPAIKGPCAGSLREVESMHLDVTRGRIPMLLEAGALVSRTAPDLEIRISMAGPFTIASHLLGIEDTILGLMLDPVEASRALDRLTENQIAYARAIAERGFDITLYESSVTPPLLSPALFSERIAPLLGALIQSARADVNAGFQLIIGGNTLPIVDGILSLLPEYVICPFETDQTAFVERAVSSPHTRVRVNMDPVVFLKEDNSAALAEADRTREIARLHPDSTVGCLLPYDARPETVLAVAEHLGG